MRKSLYVWFLFTLSLPAAAPRAAQEYPVLSPRQVVHVAGTVFEWSPYSFGIPCDADGNIYMSPSLGNPGAKISPSGKVVARFDLSGPVASTSELKDAKAVSFAVDSRGNAFVLLQAKGRQGYVVRFGSDGKYDKTIHLEAPDLAPRYLAVFDTGELLVTGFAGHYEGKRWSGVAYTAIFDRSGRSPLEVKLAGDASVDVAGLPPGTEGWKQLSERRAAMEDALLEGDVLSGWDGNVYVVRGGHPPAVYVLTPSGTLLRRMKLEPPAPGVEPMMESLSRGRLVVGYGKVSHGPGAVMGPPELYSVYDALSGERLYDYKGPKEDLGFFACYTGNDFVFVGAEDSTGSISMVYTRPK
jgi:hypothetical protein